MADISWKNSITNTISQTLPCSLSSSLCPFPNTFCLPFLYGLKCVKFQLQTWLLIESARHLYSALNSWWKDCMRFTTGSSPPLVSLSVSWARMLFLVLLSVFGSEVLFLLWSTTNAWQKVLRRAREVPWSAVLLIVIWETELHRVRLTSNPPEPSRSTAMGMIFTEFCSLFLFPSCRLTWP